MEKLINLIIIITAQQSRAHLSTAHPSTLQHYTAHPCTAQTAQYPQAHPSTAHPNTAQHIQAHPSTAQHSTADTRLEVFCNSISKCCKIKVLLVFGVGWLAICKHNQNIWLLWSVPSCWGEQLVPRHYQRQISASLMFQLYRLDVYFL